MRNDHIIAHRVLIPVCKYELDYMVSGFGRCYQEACTVSRFGRCYKEVHIMPKPIYQYAMM